MALNQNLETKELIVLNTLKYKYCANKSRDLPLDHFAKIVSYWPIAGRSKKINREITFLQFIFITYFLVNTSRLETVHCASIKKLWRNFILNAQI